MAQSVEFLIPKGMSRTGAPMLKALYDEANASGWDVRMTGQYIGESDLLVTYGVGAPDRCAARAAHVASGRRAVVWDMGYLGREKITGHLRFSIDTDHPPQYLDYAPLDDWRWASHGLALREDADASGHIVLVGLGPKSRSYLGEYGWEVDKLRSLRKRFPKRRIIFRPKPRRPNFLSLDCEVDAVSPIEKVLKGAALVVCRHSNVAVDATVAGVPFECEDGAALWLQQKGEFNTRNRREFLTRLCWFQWRTSEAGLAWNIVLRILRRIDDAHQHGLRQACSRRLDQCGHSGVIEGIAPT